MITLNVKQLAVKLLEPGERKLELAVKGPCEVTASMIGESANVEILNPELTICNINKDIDSLNVSNASAISLYELHKKNRP